MKKTSFMAALAIAALILGSCGKTAPKADLKSDVDTLSFAVGSENATQVKQQLTMMGIDTAYMDDFIKGLNEGASAVDDKKEQAYNAGVAMGLQLVFMHKGMSSQIFAGDSTKTLSMKNLLAGYISGIKGEKNVLPAEKIGELVSRIQAKAFEPNKAANEKFMKENAKKPGIKTLPGGVQYKVIKVGTGPIPTDTTMVKLNYEGKLIDGKVFDSSFEKGQPVTIVPRQFIPGFADALTRMPVGSVWEIYIPQEKGYGARGVDIIKPYSTLIFKVELLEIVTKKPVG